MNGASLMMSIEMFARWELCIEQLCAFVREARGQAFIHNENYRWVNLNQVCGERKIRITPWHVQNALQKRRERGISERDLIDWATMIIINDVFYWEAEDAAVVAGWINRLSLDFVAED
jgi:hypothetical protein